MTTDQQTAAPQRSTRRRFTIHMASVLGGCTAAVIVFEIIQALGLL